MDEMEARQRHDLVLQAYYWVHRHSLSTVNNSKYIRSPNHTGILLLSNNKGKKTLLQAKIPLGVYPGILANRWYQAQLGYVVVDS